MFSRWQSNGLCLDENDVEELEQELRQIGIA